MQVSIESSKGLERQLKIAVPADKIDQEVTGRLQKATKTVSIKGFRKGKVPLKVVKQQYGAGVRQEVIGEIVNSSFYEAIQQEELRPVGQPRIDDIKEAEGQNLEYLAIFEVYPEVKLADLSKVKVTRPVSDISADDVAKMIEVLRNQQATFDVVERAAEHSDQVNIDFVGTQKKEEFAGGSAEAQDLVLGSNSMIPGFEDGLIGASAGDDLVLKLKFPKDYHSEELKGKAVQFAVKVNSVSAKQMPEMNDEFFKLYGVDAGGEEKFREDIQANMERELLNALRTKVKNRVMDQLFTLNKVDVPAALVGNEITQLKQQMVQQFGGGQQIDLNMLPDEMFKEKAERRAALGVIVSEVVKVEELTPNEESVRARVDEIASTYEQPQEVVDYYYSKPELLSSVEAVVLEDQVTELVLSKAKVKDETLSYEDAVKPDPEPGSEA
ncbi:trigger factor [Porticoccaceae bacterium]|jgi:trigger factor|nr:trigger factor [Porticoccaceae bacterium]MDC0133891.1 trigger factor [Porticoccaceae bacterium]CAI8271467.1 MAG: Trigger factor [SAR92 bacterium MED-G29]|tara:strand:+ start:2728 stop:4047 length:1320 start_codon:yes stop_codon:yes gene_type:complete